MKPHETNVSVQNAKWFGIPESEWIDGTHLLGIESEENNNRICLFCVYNTSSSYD